MIDLSNLEAWFVTGSQHLYGAETLKKVGQHASAIATARAASPEMPVKIVAKPVMTSSESIHQLCQDANSSKTCVGLITWMHTFSPSRMWIAGLRSLSTPLLHLHTQFNKDLSRALTSEHLENFAAMAGMECLSIEGKTEVSDFVKEPRWNDMYYHLADGL